MQLAVSTGQPIQSRFSFSALPYNIEGWSYDGETSDVTIIAADAMGNPVPDGTPISFVTDYGVVEANCQTGRFGPTVAGHRESPGTCTVLVTSQGVRPADGRLRVAAYAVGEEFYEDLNSNNLHDIGEPFFDQGATFSSTATRTAASRPGADHPD